MRDELYESLWRYEAMVGIIDWKSGSDPGREEHDLAAYGKEYGLVRYPDGREYSCYARMVRFLVEVCGHSFDESVDALVEFNREQPSVPRTDLDAEGDARSMRDGNPNIIEALFTLKVNRLIGRDNDHAVAYSWEVTRALMAMEGQRKLP